MRLKLKVKTPERRHFTSLQIFFPSTGETQIYRPQPRLTAATQEVQANSSGPNPV